MKTYNKKIELIIKEADINDYKELLSYYMEESTKRVFRLGMFAGIAIGTLIGLLASLTW